MKYSEELLPGWFRRILGLLGVLLGAIGALLSLILIIMAWMYNTPLTDQALRVFPPIESALGYVDNTVERTAQFVQSTSDGLSAAGEGELDVSEIVGEVEQIQTLIDWAGNTVDTFDAVATAINGVPLLPNRSSSSLQQEIANAAGMLTQTAETLDLTESHLQSLLDGRVEARQQLGTELGKMQTLITNISVATEAAKADVAQLKRKVSRWIDWGSILITLILLWFGIAQLSLMNHSWQWLRQ